MDTAALEFMRQVAQEELSPANVQVPGEVDDRAVQNP
jgi:hypothetical protein